MNAASNAAVRPGRYLSFSLNGESYALPVENVCEINGLTRITPIPKSRPYIAGVINLRGKVIPVINLRVRFGLPTTEFTKETCVIITEMAGKQVGMIVDTVQEVTDLFKDQLVPKPNLGDEIESAFIQGLAKLENRVLILIDTAAVLSNEELKSLDKVEDQKTAVA